MSSDILAKISIDGKLISQNGLIIRRGERIFLDRYLDVPKKFQFSTYTVSNTDEVKNAIQENGDLKIEFFEEYIEPIQVTQPIYNPPLIPPFIKPWWEVTCGNTNMDINMTTTNHDISYTADNTFGVNGLISTYSNNTLEGPNKREFKSGFDNKKIETGQVSEGGESKQSMEIVNKSFTTSPFHTVEYKLLPTSQKNTTSDDLIRKYCTNCSAKIKKGDNFCGQCGSKL